MPTPPHHILEAARAEPRHWFPALDPMWTGPGEPPDWAVAGYWWSGPTGRIEEWEANEEYRPSPRARGWAEPEDSVDAAIQLAATGYGPGEEVARALADAEVAVLSLPDGSLVTAAASDGKPVVLAFSAPSYLHAVGGLAFERLGLPDLLRRLPEGHALYVNPSGPVGLVLDPAVLAEFVPPEQERTAPPPGESAIPHEEVWAAAVRAEAPNIGGRSTVDLPFDDLSFDELPAAAELSAASVASASVLAEGVVERDALRSEVPSPVEESESAVDPPAMEVTGTAPAQGADRAEGPVTGGSVPEAPRLGAALVRPSATNTGGAAERRTADVIPSAGGPSTAPARPAGPGLRLNLDPVPGLRTAQSAAPSTQGASSDD